jgi:hypothetical protein
MTTPNRAEINRRNAARSTGPKTPEGKSRSRLNALKHGLTARTLVLPGEDPEALRGRLEAFVTFLEPRNELEQYLAEEAAQSSWQIDRARRAEAARLAAFELDRLAEETFRQEDEALALGRRLFHDPRGPLPLYPHAEYQPRQPRVSDSGLIDDPDQPARLVHRLESTAAGCRWLLDRWAGLRALLDRGLAWQSPDKLKAIRLLGKQPLDAVDDPEVALIFLAVDVLRNRETDCFAEPEAELLPGEVSVYRQRLDDRRINDLAPRDEAEARAVLLAIVGHAVGRLEALAAAHRQRAEAAAARQADRLAFDASEEGERLRRHLGACGRSLSRTIDTLLKIRKAAPSEHAEQEDLAPPAAAGVENSESEPASAQSALPTPLLDDPHLPVLIPVAPLAPSEPTDTIALASPAESADPDVTPASDPAPAIDRSVLQNEATAEPDLGPASDPAPAVDRSVLRNEARTEPDLAAEPEVGPASDPAPVVDRSVLQNEARTEPDVSERPAPISLRSFSGPTHESSAASPISPRRSAGRRRLEARRPSLLGAPDKTGASHLDDSEPVAVLLGLVGPDRIFSNDPFDFHGEICTVSRRGERRQWRLPPNWAGESDHVRASECHPRRWTGRRADGPGGAVRRAGGRAGAGRRVQRVGPPAGLRLIP